MLLANFEVKEVGDKLRKETLQVSGAEGVESKTVATKVPDNARRREAEEDLFALSHRYQIYYSSCERLQLIQE